MTFLIKDLHHPVPSALLAARGGCSGGALVNNAKNPSAGYRTVLVDALRVLGVDDADLGDWRDGTVGPWPALNVPMALLVHCAVRSGDVAWVLDVRNGCGLIAFPLAGPGRGGLKLGGGHGAGSLVRGCGGSRGSRRAGRGGPPWLAMRPYRGHWRLRGTVAGGCSRRSCAVAAGPGWADVLAGACERRALGRDDQADQNHYPDVASSPNA